MKKKYAMKKKTKTSKAKKILTEKTVKDMNAAYTTTDLSWAPQQEKQISFDLFDSGIPIEDEYTGEYKTTEFFEENILGHL